MGSGLEKHRYVCTPLCTFALLWALSFHHCEKQFSRLNDDLISFSVTFFCLFNQHLETNILAFWRLTSGCTGELDFPPRTVWFHQQTSKFANHSPLDFSQLVLVMLRRREPLKISNLSLSNLLRNGSLCDTTLTSGWHSMHFAKHNYSALWWKD